ncbi:MAG TPA: CaiB/BaiF CoA-transferase family protein [Anaerolineae bacterium]|nr:CaiB/BaiF CoA-transferase family protein [Anaerolineae bacterium]
MSLFSDLTVLSLEQATTLPFLTQRLAREGVRVIRLEPPGRGDPNRYVGRDVLGEPGMASYFFANNCGKQAITLNLADPEGRAILHELIAKLPVDIFATNNRPSSYAKLGVDYETIKTIRPETIWLGITGFGPNCDEAAYDPVLQARAGWMELTGDPDGPPLVFGLPMVDLGAAEHAYGALMKALYRRAVTGEGSRIDISMYHSALAWMAGPIMLTALGERVTRRGNTHQFFAPVSVYPTRDGYVYIAVGNDRQWEAITQLPGFEGLSSPGYQRNAGRIADVERLNQRMSDCTRAMMSDDLITALNRIGVPVARVNTLNDVLSEPLARDSLLRVRDDRTATELVLAPVAEVNDGAAATLSFPPRLGEHNETILGEVLGYGREQLSELKERGVL